MKKVLIIIVLFFLNFNLISCVITKNIEDNNGIQVNEDQSYTTTVNDVEFTFNPYTKYESEYLTYDYYVLPVSLLNKSDTNIEIDYELFTFSNSNVRVNIESDLYFNKITLEKIDEIEILVQCGKNVTFKDIYLEIDFGILSWGDDFKMSKISQRKSDEAFEEFILKKYNCVKEEHFDKVLNIIFDEKLGFIKKCKYLFIDTTNEDSYLIDTTEGYFSLIYDENNNFNMINIYQTSYYDVYVNNIKNPFFIPYSRMLKEYNVRNWQNIISTLLSTLYVDVECSDYSWGRVENRANEMVIRCTVKGKNSFGMTLYKECVLYLVYDFDMDEFDSFYLKMGDDILLDDRVEVSFETNTPQNISKKKVAKNSYVTEPENLINKENCSFAGWYIKGTDIKWDFNNVICENLTLEARWISIQ